ncbi:MAG: hypothetical protein SAJ72_17070, partial [Jaaginema sp. PMC 1080.18]|nr:hypothetical protein [Jaaginema sp. PMC 1080.18]
FLELLSSTVSLDELNSDNLEKQIDPSSYFTDFWKINCIAKKDSSRYHSNSNCYHWRRLCFDYMRFKTHNDDKTDDFLISFLSQDDTDQEIPNWGKKHCTVCSPNTDQ